MKIFLLKHFYYLLLLYIFLIITRKLLKTLIGCLASDNKEMQIEVLQSLIDMLKCPELTESFSNYEELIVLKVIRAHKFDDQNLDTSINSSNSSRTTVKFREVVY